jgi:hypothetical protein
MSELWQHKRNSDTQTVTEKKRMLSCQHVVQSCGVPFEANIKPWAIKSSTEKEKKEKKGFFRRFETPRRPRFDTRTFHV